VQTRGRCMQADAGAHGIIIVCTAHMCRLLKDLEAFKAIRAV
jgi:hypothetical protein